MEKAKLPALFDGATHRIEGTGEPVKVVQWKKDGDHPLVERYPIERREFKGILRSARRRAFALRFGEFIIEDAKGRHYVESFQTLPSKYIAVADWKDPHTTAAGFVLAMFLIVGLAGLVSLLQPQSDLPMVFAVTHLMYYSTLLAQWNGSANIHDLDEAADDMQVSAHTNTYSINQDTHDFFDDLTNEVTGTNYTAGGANIDSQTTARSTNTVTFDGADVVWLQHAAGFTTARKFVVYRNSGAAGTSRLFSVVTADADVGNVTGDLTIAWNASGIAQWSTT